MSKALHLVIFSFLIVSPGAYATTLSGSIHKSNISEFMNFDLTVESMNPSNAKYIIKGMASSDKGIINTYLKYKNVKVLRILNSTTTQVKNDLVSHLSWGNRLVSGYLAGVELKGSFKQGLFDDKITFNDLYVNGKISRGLMDYNSLNGKYNSKENLSFGQNKIRSLNSPDIYIMNYDDYISQNSMNVAMTFGQLNVQGTIHFTDQSRRSCSNQDSSCTTVVDATTGFINLEIKKINGSELTMSDDQSLREFLAYFKLVTYDMFSE
ncbi:MAG: hypothetical protein V4596_05755 [Bdellovibrionota bacterium]